METAQTEKIDLNGFIGTQQYHYLNFLKNLKATDGISYLCETAKCYWLFDIFASVQHLKKVKENNSFLIWRIKRIDNNEKIKAIVDCYTDIDENGNFPRENLVYKQELTYTDFPFDKLTDNGEFTLYQCNDVILLKSEY